MNFDVAAKAIDSSLYAVVAVHKEQAVGMGRIVGDGAIFYYIQDIAVSPKHQKQGIGARILDTLMEYLKHHAPEKAFVGLFAAEGSEFRWNCCATQPILSHKRARKFHITNT